MCYACTGTKTIKAIQWTNYRKYILPSLGFRTHQDELCNTCCCWSLSRMYNICLVSLSQDNRVLVILSAYLCLPHPFGRRRGLASWQNNQAKEQESFLVETSNWCWGRCGLFYILQQSTHTETSFLFGSFLLITKQMLHLQYSYRLCPLLLPLLTLSFTIFLFCKNN